MPRFVLPLVICFVLCLGFLVMPSYLSATAGATSKLPAETDAEDSGKLSISATTTLTNACGCQPRALDVYYIVDLSSSMGQLYPGAGNKLDAAKHAITSTNNLIASWDNGSRVGLMTYYGGQNGVGNPRVYETVTTNQLAFRPFWGGLTDNLTTFNNKLFAMSANGSTPTYHALDFSEGQGIRIFFLTKNVIFSEIFNLISQKKLFNL